MADRVVDEVYTEVPEIPEILENALIYALDEAKEKMQQGADLVPFTVLVVKNNLFIESHPGDSTDECFASAKHTVEGARGAIAYAFCYDGYVELDEGSRDAVIAEGGMPGAADGYAVCYLYTINTPDEPDEDITFTFDDEPAYIGKAPNFMAKLPALEITSESDNSGEDSADSEPDDTDFDAEEAAIEESDA